MGTLWFMFIGQDHAFVQGFIQLLYSHPRIFKFLLSIGRESFNYFLGFIVSCFIDDGRLRLGV